MYCSAKLETYSRRNGCLYIVYVSVNLYARGVGRGEWNQIDHRLLIILYQSLSLRTTSSFVMQKNDMDIYCFMLDHYNTKKEKERLF